LLLWVNRRQAVLAGKLYDPLSFSEKAAPGARHDRAYLLPLCGIKGALQSFGVELSRDLLQFQLQRESSGPELLVWEIS
jgi:hypothetical protein